MQVRKFILFIIVMVVLTVLSLPNSFAVNNLPTTYAEMPEPVADEYNKYIICNDILYHFSFHIESVYTIKNPTESVWYTHVVNGYQAYNEECSGTYEFPYFQMAGHTTYNGDQTQLFFNQVYIHPVNHGLQEPQEEEIVLNRTGTNTFTYDDAELALTKVGQTFISDTYYLQLYVYDQSNIFIRIYPNERLSEPVVVTASYCLSMFSLDTGEMLRSEYQTITDTTLALKQWRIALYSIYQDGLSNYYNLKTLKPYGFVVANPYNTEYDIPQVVWDLPTNWDSYFLNTMLYVEEIWRNMVQVTSPVEPDTTARWGENLSDSVPENDLEVRPAGQEIALTQALNNINLSPQSQDKIEQWTDLFSNGKLIACCVFALACGSVILTLGKKKSE